MNREQEFSQTRLFKALEDVGPDTLSGVKKLLDQGEQVNARGAYEETYLHVLSGPREEDSVHLVIPIIHLLAKAGIDVNAKDREGNTALHIFALNELHHSVAAHFLKVGVDPNATNNDDQQALELTEEPRNRVILEHSYPGLLQAVRSGDVDKTKRMLEFWHRVDQKIENESLIEYAREEGNRDIVRALNKEKDTSALVTAALSGDLREVKEVSKREGVDLDTIDYCHMRDDGDWAPMPLLVQTTLLGHYACAKVLCKRGCDVNIEVQLEKDKREPLFLYVLRKHPPSDAELIRALLDTADASLIRDTPELLYTAWKTRMPLDIIELLISKGLRFTMRDEKGYTVRDKIFMACYDKDERVLKENLYFIDRHVIRMALDGAVSKLRELSLDSYDYINVLNLEGESALQLAKKNDLKKVVKFMNNLPEFQRKSAMLHKAIEKGNYAEFKELIDGKLINCRDKGGRSMLHKAVLYERKFIIQHIVNEWPETVKQLDYYWRTPLHYACMIPDSGEIERQLTAGGASPDTKDYEGKIPEDYRRNPDILFIANERHKEYDLDVFLLDRYINFTTAIHAKDMTRLQEVHSSMYGVSINEFDERLPGRTKTLPYKNIVFQCVNRKFEQGAIFLVNEGAEHNITGQKVKGIEEYRAKLTVLRAVARLTGPHDRDYTLSRLSSRASARDYDGYQRPGSLMSNSTMRSNYENELMDIEEMETSSNTSSIETPPKKKRNRGRGSRGSTANSSASSSSNQNKKEAFKNNGGEADEMQPTSQACVIL